MLNQNVHTEYFKNCRNESLNKISDPTNNLIIRLDKLINDFHMDSEDYNRKEFEKRVVPWVDNSDFQHCNLCKMRFTLTKRKHHCRLCGTIICGNACSQFLSFASAKKLTGLEFSADILTALSKEDFQQETSSLFGGESVDKPSRNRRLSAVSIGNTVNSALNNFGLVRTRLGTLMAFGENGKEEGKPQNGITSSAGEEPSLRICRQCKDLLERRERMMELRMANSVFVDVYQKLCSLLCHIAKLAPAYRNMTESLNNGETMYSLEAANDLRKKMIGIQREITALSERIEQWGLLENDPLVTQKPTERELQLQKNIRMLAINSLHDSVVGMPDLPTPERYEQLKEEYRQRVQQQIELERERERKRIQQQSQLEEKNSMDSINSKSLSSTPVISAASGISSLIREFRPSSSGAANSTAARSDSSSELSSNRAQHKTRRPTKMRPSSSFTGGMGDTEESGWVPEENPFQQQQKLNPFLEDELGEMHPIQQQYLITRSYLEQAAKAGRLDEVEMLERNLRDLELNLKRLELETPRPS